MASKSVPSKLTRNQELWLVSCAVITFLPMAGYATVWVTAAVSLAFFWRVIILWRKSSPPPGWVLSLLVAIGSAGVFFTHRQFFGKDPGTDLLCLFLALKLFELRQVRDGLTIIFLCYFLLITHFLEAQDLPVAGLAILSLIIITASLASLAHPKRSALAHIREATILLTQSIPFMLVLFLLFPRIQGPLWGMPADAYSAMTGLSDSMSPGSISKLSQSSQIAFRIRFEEDPPSKANLYWRGPVLKSFDGRTWRAGIEKEKVSPHNTAPGVPVGYTVTLEPHNKRWLFALDKPLNIPAGALLTQEYQLLSKVPIRNRIRYKMQSDPSLAIGLDEDESTLQQYRKLPPGNPKTRELIRQWRAEFRSDEALAGQMLSYIREENFVYTLTPPLLGEENGIDQFIFSTRRGFCEHFASAFVFAMRAADIPARIVTGYQGGEYNPIDGYLIVRQSDAHAWAEIWLSGKGWVRVDPTGAIAPERIEAGLASALPSGEPLPYALRVDLFWLKQIRFRWEAVTNAWEQWVLGYDSQRQQDMLSRFGMHQPDWESMTIAMSLLCAMLLLGLTAWALRHQIKHDPLVRAWRRFSQKMSRYNLVRQEWEGPEDYAKRISSTQPDLAHSTHEIVSLYISLRYGKLHGRVFSKRLNQLISKL